MRRALISLYVLLSTLPPAPQGSLIRAAVLLACYGSLLPLQPQLTTLGLDPLILSVIAAFVFQVAWNMGQRRDSFAEGMQESPLILLSGVVVIPSAVFWAMLNAPAPLWVQHGVSAYFAIYAVLLIYLAARHPMSELLSCAKGVENQTERAFIANWRGLSFLALAVGSEAVIAGSSQVEWVLYFAGAPIVAYYVLYWTLLALYPDPASDDPPDTSP